MLCNRPNPQALGASMHHEHEKIVLERLILLAPVGGVVFQESGYLQPMGGCPLQRLNGRARFGEDWLCQLPIIGGPDLFPAKWWRELLLSPCADRGVVAGREAVLPPRGEHPPAGVVEVGRRHTCDP